MEKRRFLVVRLMGGLGNQMFQYATGLAMSKKLNRELLLDLSLLGKKKQSHEIEVSRNFELSEIFKGPFEVAPRQVILRLYPYDSTLRIRFLSLLYRNWDKGFLYHQHGHSLIDVEDRPNQIVGLVGRFQSDKYFSDFYPQIFSAFTFKNHLSLEGKKMSDSWAKSKSFVGVHVRRGDYVSHPVYSRTLGFVGTDYLNRAITYFRERDSSVRFVFMSDDPDWCEKNYGHEGIIMRDSFAASHSHSDFMLLSSFNKLIISNSTFGWWAGKFADYERNAEVVAPKIWVREDRELDEVQRIPKHWIKL